MITWHKSSYSGTGQSDCVELAALPGGHVGVRDSKAPGAGNLTLSREVAARLLAALKGA